MLCMAGQEGEEKPRSMVTPTGYWYSDHGSTSTTPSHQNQSIHQTHMVNHELQSFEPNSEIYNLTSGMEMIGFPPKNLHHHHHQHQQSDPSSSKNMTSEVLSSSDFYNQHGFTKPEFNTTSHETMMVLVDDDPSLRCVFPCEGNERPSQGLSLSLSSSNPSSIGLQSFELRHHQDDHRDIGFFGKSMNIQQQQQQEEIMNHHHQQQGYFQIRNSKYLGPAQELLNEFCSLGTKKNDHYNNSLKVQKPQQDETASTSSKKQLLQSIDFLELQKRKTKLLQMLEEVDRRYKHYCDQMKAVVSSFEAVAGNGTATVYSCLASKAMSRHFRSLRDGIVGQIKETKKAMGEKDYVSPGTTKGETPRLRILDQTLRQQKAFQQISMMESHPWRPQRGLPERSVSVLRAWLFEHFLHPYPSDVDKHILARQTGLSRSQVSNWFINARVRLWKPMVEEMYIEETKEQENLGTPDACKALDHDMNSHDYDPHTQTEDQKPNLVRIDSECISSIINHHHSEKNDTNNSKCLQDHQHFQPHLHQQAFGAIELDFSAGASGYNYGGGGGGGSKNLGSTGGGGGRGGVSLTLGLQQHGDQSGMGLTFSQASQSTSLYYTTRDDIDQDCQQVHEYSLLDSENQNLPYRNLMGAQLLHDLAG